MRQVPQPARYIHDLARNTVAYVLAGGKGTRLGSLTKVRAKPATPFGGKYRIIDFTLSNCINSGIHRIGVLTQYNAIGLINHIQRTWGHLSSEMGEFVSLLPAHLGESKSWYAGTADAIWQNLQTLEQSLANYCLVLAGDHVYTMDYLKMIEAHVNTNADVTVGCIDVPPEIARRFGVLECDADGTIRQFAEKPDDPSPYIQPDGAILASMGIYVFSKKALIDLLAIDHETPESSHDFGKDILPKAIQSHRLVAYRFTDDNNRPGYWRDVGTLEAYYEASMELLAAVPRLNLYDRDWRIWTYQEHLPPVRLTHDSAGHHALVQDSLISTGSLFIGSKVSRSICCYSVRIESDAEVCHSILLPDVHVGKGCQIQRAIVDEGCRVPDGMMIGHDREADAQRFSITDNGVVMVTREHLNRLLDRGLK